MAAYDAVTQKVLLFGKSTDQTWAWNDRTWTRQFPRTSPAARDYASMADDTATNRVIVFGGIGGAGFFNDLWAWDGTTWQRYD